MLVGDRGQPGQAHQVFVTGVRIVHPRVASVGGQVLHRLQQCSAGCVGDRLATTSSDRSARISETLLGAQWSDQTHALRAHRTLAHAHRRSDPLVKPARHYLCVGVPADTLSVNPTKAAVTWVSPASSHVGVRVSRSE